jgi:hypothetical protein
METLLIAAAGARAANVPVPHWHRPARKRRHVRLIFDAAGRLISILGIGAQFDENDEQVSNTFK